MSKDCYTCGGNFIATTDTRVMTRKVMSKMTDDNKTLLYFTGKAKGGVMYTAKNSGRQYRAGNNSRDRVVAVLNEDVQGLKSYHGGNLFKTVDQLTPAEKEHFGVEDAGTNDKWQQFADIVGANGVKALEDAGITNLDTLKVFTKPMLMAIDGVGEATADKILSAVKTING